MRILLLTALGAASLAGCGLDVAGTQDLAANATDASARFDAPGNADGIAFDAPGSVDGCVSTGPEICTDGVDNDCNGATDCADNACATAGFACVPSVPSGWALAEVDTASRPACPPGFGSAVDFVADPTGGAAQCGCGCSLGTPPSCVHGMFGDRWGGSSSCGAGAALWDANDGNCFTRGAIIISNVEVDVLPPYGGTCGSAVSANIPSDGTTPGRACPNPGPYGAGCASGNVCAKVGPSPLKACVTQSGDLPCVGGYGTKHLTGTSVNDTRACSTCACGPPTATCANGTWSFYGGNNCGGAPGTVLQVTGQCLPASSGVNDVDNSYIYAATPTNIQCAVSAPSSPTGSLTLTGTETICCAP